MAAYLAAPFIAATLLCLVIAIPYVGAGRYTLGFALQTWAIMASSSIPIGVVVELIFVTPILVAYRHFHWRWPNIWVAGVLGVLIVEALNQLVLLLGFDHHHHWFGWGAVLQGVAVSGFVGLTAAIAFHLVAVRSRRVELASPAANVPTIA